MSYGPHEVYSAKKYIKTIITRILYLCIKIHSLRSQYPTTCYRAKSELLFYQFASKLIL